MRKKENLKMGFTLIELLGIVILLAVISLIATPIVLNAISEAQASADMTSAHLIVSDGHNYYASSLLDEEKADKINNYENVYDDLNIMNKPELGQLYVNDNDKVAMAVIINGKCYKKDYMSEIEIVDISECDLGYMGPDNTAPTVELEVGNTNINENGWYNKDIYLTIAMEDTESGVFGYKRCIGQSECEPDDTVYTTTNNVIIATESANNYVCVIGIDNRGNQSDKVCEIYKLDKTLPNIEGVGDLIVNKDEEVELRKNVTYSDALSGIDGELSITPSSIDTKVTGTKQVVYSIKDIAGNVREIIRNIIIDADAPNITFSLVDSSAINSNGWAKNDFYVKANITDNSGSGIKEVKSCTTNSNGECSPVLVANEASKTYLIATEGSNRACIEVTDNNNKTTKVCSDTYKLDKTAPVAGTATFTGTLGTNDWYRSNVTVNKVNGSDALSGHSSTTSNVSSITSNTSGTTITITTTDLAGNTASRNYTIKVDKTAPNSFTISASGVTVSGFTVNGTTTDGLSGVSSYKLYLNGSYYSSNTTGKFTLTGLSSGTTYTAYVIATDNAGNTVTSNTISQQTTVQYVWNKYTISETVTRDTDTRNNRGWSVYVMIGTDYTYDSSTQRYEVSGSTQFVYGYDRSYYNSGYRYLKIESCLDGGYSNLENCSSVYYIRSAVDYDTFNAYVYTPIVTQDIGSFVGTVTSTSSSAYPTNGISGSYWYVRQ